ncbi:hypothetical protein N7549_16400 [Escherichia coli]|nr:hypothetical protein [Escherichia coli]MCT9916980.1 hypothetical protein [Escherichia coli]MCV5122582.1 hypothetical protein [Escherichia coli]
MKYINCVYNIN